jgi:hypothetical protein
MVTYLLNRLEVGPLRFRQSLIRGLLEQQLVMAAQRIVKTENTQTKDMIDLKHMTEMKVALLVNIRYLNRPDADSYLLRVLFVIVAVLESI